HNTIEHDASISRGDFALGDNFHFNETIFSALANSNPGVDFYNATSAGQVQKQRLVESQATNPQLINTRKEIAIRTSESALYLSVMGDPLTGVVPKNFVNIFFREERLPLEEGWKRPILVIKWNHLGSNVINNPESIRMDSGHQMSFRCANSRRNELLHSLNYIYLQRVLGVRKRQQSQTQMVNQSQADTFLRSP
ncbi:hypothetical protein C8J56DRAFT_804841, partial [Mycena floridula]